MNIPRQWGNEKKRERERERERRGGIAVFESSAVIDCTYQQRGTIQKVSPLPGQAKEIPKRRTHRSGPRFSTGRADFSMQLPATMTLVKRSERENAGVTSNMEEWNLKFRLFRFSIWQLIEEFKKVKGKRWIMRRQLLQEFVNCSTSREIK